MRNPINRFYKFVKTGNLAETALSNLQWNKGDMTQVNYPKPY